MPAIKVGVREFREQFARYLESDTPVAVTRRGETLGVYVPTPRKQIKPAELGRRRDGRRVQATAPPREGCRSLR